MTDVLRKKMIKMNSTKKSLAYWWLPLILTCALTYIIQSNTYLYMDQAFILHTAQQFLEGQRYGQSIFEPNPPMIFYLQMPALLIAKFFHINLLIAFRLYLIAVCIISLFITRYLLIQIFFSQPQLIYLFSYVLFFNFLILPANQFGQRECFMMMLTLPYLFSAALKLNQQKISTGLAVVVGIMAGIGFSIKPHFLTTLVLIELYFIFKKRHLFGWVRIESIIIAVIMFSYLCVILIIYPAYLKDVLPLWWSHYIVVKQPWINFVFDPFCWFCLSALVFYFCSYQKKSFPILSQILLLALLGFIITFLIPQVDWNYHILPAFNIACLLFALTYWQSCYSIHRTRLYKTSTAIFIVLIPLSLAIYLTSLGIYTFKKEKRFESLIAFFNQQKSDTTFDIISISFNYIALEFYSTAKYVGSFVTTSWNYDLCTQNPAFLKNETYGVNVIARDLENKQPHFVLINNFDTQDYLGRPYDYLFEYTQFPEFQTAWKKYRYLKMIDGYEVYEHI